jgi:uncharacterized protein with PIN domain
MIIDPSAVLAVVLAEPDAARHARAIAASETRRIPSRSTNASRCCSKAMISPKPILNPR